MTGLLSAATGLAVLALAHTVRRFLRANQIKEGLEAEVEKRTLELGRLNRRLSEKRAQLRIVANSMPWLVSYIDREERYVYVNRTYELWWGQSASHCIGKPVRDILPAAVYEICGPRIKEALAGHEVSYELTTSFVDATRATSVTYVPDLDDAGAVRGIVALVADITKHKGIEEALRRAKDTADEASRAKSAFLANMSHEIRTPLAAVLGYSELLLNDRQPVGERHQYVNAIKRNGELLRNIIDDILDLTKVESGTLRIDRVAVSLHELLAEVGGMLRQKAQQKGVRLEVDTRLGAADRIVTDPMRLRQILLNLVGNAVKFTQSGRVAVSAEPARPPDGGIRQIAFVVSDTGCGIEAQHVEHLFQPFSQASLASSKKYGGAGLGLALSRKLARELGGDLRLTSTAVGVGTSFTLTVAAEPATEPRAQLPEPRPTLAPKSAAPLPAVTKPQGALRGVHVLLVEDSPDNQLIIGHYLKLAGAAVELARNGEEGVVMAMTGAFDVVLMDIQMPVMDGYGAAKELRRRGYDRPVVALTACAMKEERERALASGFDDHLPKPVDRSALLTLVIRLSGMETMPMRKTARRRAPAEARLH